MFSERLRNTEFKRLLYPPNLGTYYYEFEILEMIKMAFKIKLDPPVPFKWRGNHHLYHGLWFIGFGLFQWYMGIDNSELTKLIPFWQSLVTIGIFMAVDDIIEHTITGSTPLRIIYVKVVVPLLRGK